MGSRAEQGSSSRMTSGSTAMARAMHRRCCWPPERPRALSCEAVADLVPQRRAAQALLDDVVELAALGDPLQLAAVGDVLPDRLGERVGLLEHHADALAQQVHVELGVEDAVALEQHVALDAHALDEVVEAVEAADERRLAAARGADEGGDAALRDLQRDVVERLLLAVPERQFAGRRRSGSAKRRLGRQPLPRSGSTSAWRRRPAVPSSWSPRSASSSPPHGAGVAAGAALAAASATPTLASSEAALCRAAASCRARAAG